MSATELLLLLLLLLLLQQFVLASQVHGPPLRVLLDLLEAARADAKVFAAPQHDHHWRPSSRCSITLVRTLRLLSGHGDPSRCTCLVLIGFRCDLRLLGASLFADRLVVGCACACGLELLDGAIVVLAVARVQVLSLARCAVHLAALACWGMDELVARLRFACRSCPFLARNAADLLMGTPFRFRIPLLNRLDRALNSRVQVSIAG